MRALQNDAYTLPSLCQATVKKQEITVGGKKCPITSTSSGSSPPPLPFSQEKPLTVNSTVLHDCECSFSLENKHEGLRTGQGVSCPLKQRPASSFIITFVKPSTQKVPFWTRFSSIFNNSCLQESLQLWGSSSVNTRKAGCHCSDSIPSLCWSWQK